MTKIPTVQLSHQGPKVGVQGLGCMGMSDFYGARDDAQSLATLNHALDRGVTLIDTADMYGQGANERLIAGLLKTRRDEVVIATKFGIVRKAEDPNYFGVSNTPDYIRECVQASLHRLGTECIDLYYMHRRDPAVPLADSVGTMSDLVKEGLVRHIGLSEVSAEELREAHGIHPIAAIQMEWSLFSRDAEVSVVPAAAALGIGFVAYSPLGRGQLTSVAPQTVADDPSDIRNYLPRFTGENAKSNATLVAEIAKIATVRNATVSQIALAWIHSRSTIHGLTVVPIPGTRHAGRLDENVMALSILLTPEELRQLEPLGAQVKGVRPI